MKKIGSSVWMRMLLAFILIVGFVWVIFTKAILESTIGLSELSWTGAMFLRLAGLCVLWIMVGLFNFFYEMWRPFTRQRLLQEMREGSVLLSLWFLVFLSLPNLVLRAMEKKVRPPRKEDQGQNLKECVGIFP